MVIRQLEKWETVKIQDVATISRGVTWKSTDEYQESSDETIRVYKIPHVQPGMRYQLNTDKTYITIPKKCERYLLQNDDILMVGSNGNPDRVGNVVLVRADEPSLFASFLLRLRNTERTTSEFLYYTLINPAIQAAVTADTAGSTGLKNINATTLKELEVLLPSLPEQRKIAAILTSVDDAIAATQRIIDQVEVVKRGLMQHLLTKGIGHTEFKQTEIGEIPVGWDVVSFADVVKIQAGFAFKSAEFSNEGDRLLRGANVSVQTINWEDTQCFPTHRRKEFEEYILKAGDVVIAMDRPFVGSGFKVARICESDLPALLLQRVSRINESDKILQDFTYVILRSEIYEKQLRNRAVGMDLPHISAKDIGSPLIPVPPVIEQRKIASIINIFDSKLAVEKKYKAQLEYLKTGLMQVLLTGKVRVNVDELSEVSS